MASEYLLYFSLGERLALFTAISFLAWLLYNTYRNQDDDDRSGIGSGLFWDASLNRQRYWERFAQNEHPSDIAEGTHTDVADAGDNGASKT